MCDGESAWMLEDMIYLSHAQQYSGEGILVTLKDLVPGTKYSVRNYYWPWDPPLPRPLTIFGDGASNGAFLDSIQIDIDRPGAHYLDYTFVADDNDVMLKFIHHDLGQGAHIYGLSCEIVLQTDVDSKPSAKPSTYELMQSYPNPFNPQTTIEYQLPEKTHVSLKVFDISGREVSTLVNGEQPQGRHNIKLYGHNLPSGIYLYRLTTDKQTLQKRMLLLK